MQELVVIDHPILIAVNLVDEFIDFGLIEIFTECSHEYSEFLSMVYGYLFGDVVAAVFVK
jgi:hypothetical protein